MRYLFVGVTFWTRTNDQKVDFNIGGVIQKIKNQTAFNKIVTSLM